jgi:serine protease Do
MSNILSKHRKAAILGAAIIMGTASLPFAMQTTGAVAAPVQINNALASNGSFASIVDVDKPAVVTITTTLKATNANANADDEGTPDQQFRKFFEQQGIPVPGQRQQQHSNGEHAMALGSGFIVKPDGVIVTNNHVIENATDIKVTLDDGTELPAKLLGADPKSDLAVLKIDAKQALPTIAWGDSSNLKLGDQILAIGNPFGIGTTVTAGIVSARGRDLHSGPYDDFIQIDAPINHGNSGGPLVDKDGNVVGINTAIYSPNGGSVGVGFAIPSDEAKAVVAKLEKNGSIDHGYLGVEIQPVTKDVADAIGLTNAQGALVNSVTDDSAAAKAGLKSGDIVLKVGENDVKTPKDLSRFVADLAPRDKETITVWRNGEDVDLNVVVGGNDSGKQVVSTGEEKATGPAIGVGLADLTPEARAELKLPDDVQGAVVANVNPDKPAAEAGVQSGDVIRKVNNKEVRNAHDAKQAVADAAKSGKKSVLLLIERAGHSTFVAVPFAVS